MSVTEAKSVNTAEQNAELSSLVKQRGILKGRLTKFGDYLNNVSELSTITSVKYKELELKLNKCQLMLNEYEVIQDKIDLLHEDSNEQIKERDTVENQFLRLIAIGQ